MLMDSAPVNLIFCDPKHIISYANPASLTTLDSIAETAGIRAGEPVGRSVALLFGSDEATGEVQSLASQVSERSSVIAASIEQLSLVAESTEEDAAGTDREAHKLFELASPNPSLTSRFVC